MANTKRQTITFDGLWQHQQATVELLREEPRVFDCSDAGTGKTLAALFAYHERDKTERGKLLIIAPKTLLESAWAAEIRKYFTDFSYSIAYAENREKAFAKDVEIYITNTDAVKWVAEQGLRWIKKMGFNSLIVDESTAFKNPKTQRSKALNVIKKQFQYRQALTGTPNSNTILDIWNQMFVLDDGLRLGNNYWRFRSQVCVPDPIGLITRWIDKPDIEPQVSAMIADMTVRHKLEQCIDIPPNHSYRVDFAMNPRQRNLYNDMERDALLQFNRREQVKAVNAAVLQNKLLQIASGAVYTNQDYKVLDTQRYEMALDLVEERFHSVVFFNWRHQKDQLIAGARKRKLKYALIDGTVKTSERNKIVRNFQHGDYQVLFLHPRTGAHGLTLTRGTATIWVSPIFEADYMRQGLARIWRGGQTQPTHTILIQAKNTIEHHVYDVLNKKTKRMMHLLNMLQVED